MSGESKWERQFRDMTGVWPERLKIYHLDDANDFLRSCGVLHYAPCLRSELGEYFGLKVERAVRERGGRYLWITDAQVDAAIRVHEGVKETLTAQLTKQRTNRQVAVAAFEAAYFSDSKAELRKLATYRSYYAKKAKSAIAWKARRFGPQHYAAPQFCGTPYGGISEQHLVIDMDVDGIDLSPEPDWQVIVVDQELRRMDAQRGGSRAR